MKNEYSVNASPIAVLDSGVGGISVLKELVKLMPNEHYIFFGDEANAPFGTKSRDEVKNIVFRDVEKLISQYHIKTLVIACNTATGAAVEALREKYPSMPIIGIEPEIKTAALMSEHPKVLIMATPLTLNQPKFLKLRDRFANEADYTLLACDGLMELIEAGHIDDDELRGYLDRIFTGIDIPSYDAVVLGCTHYPHIKEEIRRRFRRAGIFDGCPGTAAEAKRRIEESGISCEASDKAVIEFISSSSNPDFEKICNFLMNL